MAEHEEEIYASRKKESRGVFRKNKGVASWDQNSISEKQDFKQVTTKFPMSAPQRTIEENSSAGNMLEFLEQNNTFGHIIYSG